METINDRIEQILEERFSGNRAALCKVLGLRPTSLGNYVGRSNRRSKPGIDLVAKIVSELGIDPLWLLTGKESISSNDNQIPVPIPEEVPYGPEMPSDRNELLMKINLLQDELARTRHALNVSQNSLIALQQDMIGILKRMSSVTARHDD